MRFFAITTLAAILTFAPGVLKADDADKDREKLQGSWEMVEAVMNGKAAPDADRAGMKIVFTGEKMKLTGPGGIGEREFSIKLDPSKKPKAIDLTVLQSGGLKGTAPGIYELDGDSLKLCMPNKDVGRPMKFESTEGSLVVLFVLKRAKP